MDNWRKKGDKCNQQLARTKSNNHYRKPSLGGSSNWQQNVHSWEKRFVTSVGSLSWKKFLEAKRFTHLYDNIMKWDDSAGEEAFQNAKNRFYAKTRGLPCDIELPNPDLYVDEIDWFSGVDRNLILDLESDFVPPDANSKHEPVVIFGDAIPNPYQSYSPYGWGDSDDKMKKATNAASPDNNGINWDDKINDWDEWDVGAGNSWWVWNENDNKAKGDQGWGDDKNVYWGWNTCDNNYPSYGNENIERREGGGRYMSSHKTSRFHGDNDQRSHSWRNNGNRRKSTAQGHGNEGIQAHGS